MSSRPVSSPSSVRSPGSLIRTQLSGRLVSSPSGVQRLVSVRPPGRSRLVPRPPGAGDGDTSVRRDSGHDCIESSFMWSGPLPGGSVDGPRRHGCGHRCGVGCRPAGERRRRTWAEMCSGGRLRPTDQAGRPPRGRPSLATALGQGSWLKRDVAARHRVGGHLAWRRDYSAWSLPSLMSEWTGPEGPNELGGQDGARPQRGPARKRARPAQRQQRFDLRRWWWARQGLNL